MMIRRPFLYYTAKPCVLALQLRSSQSPLIGHVRSIFDSRRHMQQFPGTQSALTEQTAERERKQGHGWQSGERGLASKSRDAKWSKRESVPRHHNERLKR